MLRYLLILSLCFMASVVSAQKLKGRVFENNTRIALTDVFIENLTNKQSIFTDAKGRFAITAKPGDLLTFKGFAYQNDTLLITNSKDIEVFMEPKKNELAQVNITSAEINKSLNTYYDPQFHGQPMVYQRDKEGNYKGGIVLRMWYWKKDEKKKARLQQKLKDFEAMDRIYQLFSAKNLTKYIPLQEEDMENFIALYTPTLKEYKQNGFNAIDYINMSYKKYMALPPEKRKPEKLKQD
jgi:hypothetical protein